MTNEQTPEQTIERTPEQITATANELRRIRTKQDDRTMFRAVNAFCASLETLNAAERQAWINWLQARYGVNT